MMMKCYPPDIDATARTVKSILNMYSQDATLMTMKTIMNMYPPYSAASTVDPALDPAAVPAAVPAEVAAAVAVVPVPVATIMEMIIILTMSTILINKIILLG